MANILYLVSIAETFGSETDHGTSVMTSNIVCTDHKLLERMADAIDELSVESVLAFDADLSIPENDDFAPDYMFSFLTSECRLRREDIQNPQLSTQYKIFLANGCKELAPLIQAARAEDMRLAEILPAKYEQISVTVVKSCIREYNDLVAAINKLSEQLSGAQETPPQPAQQAQRATAVQEKSTVTILKLKQSWEY